jgi:hypothetical protein
MKIQLQILIVIAGRDALATCGNYYKSMKSLIGDSIPLMALMNEGTFGGIESIEQGKEILQNAQIEFLSFGGLGESESSKDVIRLITTSQDPSTLNFAGRLTYRKALEQVQNILTVNG